MPSRVPTELAPPSPAHFDLPDGSERFLATEVMLRDVTERLGGTLLDPLRTTIVHGQRSMMTWVARRDA